MEKLYDCNELAERYGVDRLTIWRWIRQKRFPAIKIGKEYRVHESDLIAFENQNKK